MAYQIVITEKTSQAKDVRAAVGSRYGDILPAEGHLFDLEEPEEVVPEWKRWSPILLRPEGLYATRPADGGNKAAKLKVICKALRTAKRVWLATDCDREGQLIGQEILEHYKYRGEVMRVLFTAQDSQTIRDAFGHAKPNSEYSRLYAAAVARRQADQIYNLSLTRTATVILGQGARGVIGVGRVKTPTLAIVCKRELEIRDFVPARYFEIVTTAKVPTGEFQMRHARGIESSSARTLTSSSMQLKVFRGLWACASRTRSRVRPNCTISPRCKNSAHLGSVGLQQRPSKSLRNSMTARARRSSLIPAPRYAICRRP